MYIQGTGTARGFAINRETFTVRFERRVDAEPQHVFDAWTQPEQVRCWWDPSGTPLDTCEIDLRPGGHFTFVSAGHAEHPFAGTYTEVAPPTRLAFEALGAMGHVTLNAAGGGTNMVVDIVCRSAEHLDQFIRMGVHEGTSRTMDNLVAFARRA